MDACSSPGLEPEKPDSSAPPNLLADFLGDFTWGLLGGLNRAQLGSVGAFQEQEAGTCSVFSSAKKVA